MNHRHQLLIGAALVASAAFIPVSPPRATAVSGAVSSKVVTIDGVGLIPANGKRYITVLRLRQIAAFVAIYHTTYKGSLTAHVSVDRYHRTIYRDMMSSTTRGGRSYFYVWTRFYNPAHLGHVVAYLTIQAAGTKTTTSLPFTLVR